MRYCSIPPGLSMIRVRAARQILLVVLQSCSGYVADSFIFLAPAPVVAEYHPDKSLSVLGPTAWHIQLDLKVRQGTTTFHVYHKVIPFTVTCYQLFRAPIISHLG